MATNGRCEVGSSITSRAEDAFVLPVADRRTEIPTSQREEGGIGQSPLWYGDAHPEKVREDQELVAHYRALRTPQPPAKPGRPPLQPDIETRLAVEKAALDIARAMMTEPTLLLLDEPAAGMNPNESPDITELIGQLRHEAGLTIILIEHDMTVVGGISDRVIALEHGVKIAEGTFEQVATDENVVEAYLGRRQENK